MEEENDVLRCRDLTKTYFQGDTHIVAVDHCFLRVKKGEMAIIVGSSGSGKSTLLHMLAGLDRPTAGEVLIEGRDPYRLSDKEAAQMRGEKTGFIFQSFHLLPSLTAKENILMPSLIAKKPHSKYYFDELVTLLGLSDRLNHLPSELSGGQQQRVAVARALINQPSILFADEPTGNLDRNSADELMELLKRMKQTLSQTIVMVTHDEKIAALADKLYRMENGVLTGMAEEQK